MFLPAFRKNNLNSSVQIYDCETGVVKCFDVYFLFHRKDAKSQSFIFQKFDPRYRRTERS